MSKAVAHHNAWVMSVTLPPALWMMKLLVTHKEPDCLFVEQRNGSFVLPPLSYRAGGGGVGQVCGAIALPTGLGWAPRLLQINLTYIGHLPLAWIVQEMPAGLGKLAARPQTWKTRHLEPMVLAAGQLLQAKSHHKLKPP